MLGAAPHTRATRPAALGDFTAVTGIKGAVVVTEQEPFPVPLLLSHLALPKEHAGLCSVWGSPGAFQIMSFFLSYNRFSDEHQQAG